MTASASRIACLDLDTFFVSVERLFDPSLIGKPVGGDLKERKITLPLIHAFQQSDAAEVRRIKRLVARPKRGDIKRVIQFALDHGGVEYARQRAQEYNRQAVASLSCFPPSDVRGRLEDLSAFAVQRDH